MRYAPPSSVPVRGIPLCLALAASLVACGDGDASPDATPEDASPDSRSRDATPSDAGLPDAAADAGATSLDYCPGRPGCPDEGDGALFAGAAAASITPREHESTDVLTTDANGDGRFDPETDDYEDRNGNGMFDPTWMAGFSPGRAATGVSDDQWVRAVAVRQNQTTIVLAAIDCVGYFHDEVEAIREEVSGLDVDYLAVAATHTHQARDTLGIWGRTQGTSGIAPEYMTFLRERAAMAVEQAVASLAPASIQYAAFRLRDKPGGMTRYLGDLRDPKIIDDEVRLLRFQAVDGGETIGTLVNWGSHPEYGGSDNTLLSSDYPHWLRDGIENGVEGPDGPVPGLGGIAVYFPGALGGQIGPNHIAPTTWDGAPLPGEGLMTAAEIGHQVAYFALEALGPEGGSVTEATARVAYRRRTFRLAIENALYHFAFLGGIFDDRPLYDYRRGRVIDDDNLPRVETEVAVIDIGRARLLTVPGELHPELLIGGYDGAHTPDGMPIVSPDNDNPPDLSGAPSGPHLAERARRDGAEHIWVLGLANDMLGYLVPPYNYELNPESPWFQEAPGDHYEETNSVGADGWPRVEAELDGLLELDTGQ
jgi:hypothetical protein